MNKTVPIMIFLVIAVLGVTAQTMSAAGGAATYSSLTALSPVVAQTTNWQTDDTLILYTNKIDWTERRFNPRPSGAQAIGWIEFHQREHFVSYTDIFLDLSEKFDWDKVSSSTFWKDAGFYTQFPSWESFAGNITKSTSWWLEFSWGLNSKWYGISANSTVIQVSKEGSIATITIWCHVSKVSEYLIGHSFKQSIFDLYSVDLGKMEIYEYYFDSTKNDQSVYFHFSAPSTMLRQEGDSFTASVRIAPLRQNALSEDSRSIVIVMPTPSEVESVSPSNLGSFKKNAATFTISASDRLPASFIVSSGPHNPSTMELIIQNLTSPDRILVIGGVATVIFSSFQGIRLMRKRRTHSRTARLIAMVYRDYRKNPEKFDQELDRLHDLLYRLVTEDKISDDQFDKLLGILEKMRKEEFGEK